MQKIGMQWTDSAINNTDVSLVAADKNGNTFFKNITTGKQVMPYIKGMTLKDALHLCETSGLQASIRGKGRVARQSIVPGAPFYKGQKIIIELKNTNGAVN